MFVEKFLMVQQFNRALDTSVMASTAFFMFFEALVKICNVTDVVGVVGTSKNVDTDT